MRLFEFNFPDIEDWLGIPGTTTTTTTTSVTTRTTHASKDALTAAKQRLADVEREAARVREFIAVAEKL